MRKVLPAVAGLVGAGLLVALGPAGAVSADGGGGAAATVRISVAADGTQSNDTSFNPVISRNGRYVAFVSRATNLVPSDPVPAGQNQTYLRDLQEGTLQRVTLDGAPAEVTDFSASGERMLIRALGGLYVRDLPAGPNRRVDLDLGDFAGGSPSGARISGSGRYVVFTQSRPAGSTAAEGSRVYVRDLLDATTQWVSQPDTGAGTRYADGAVISDDGQRVAYTDVRYPSTGPAKGHALLLDRSTGERQTVDVAQDGSTPERAVGGLSLSADGTVVLFNRSDTSPVTANDQNATTFVRDLAAGTTRPAPFGRPTSFGSLSADGRSVLLMAGVVGPTTPTLPPLFLWDRVTGQAQLATVTKDGGPATGYPGRVAMTGDGRTFVFESLDSDVVAGDTNRTWDVFVRTLPPAT
ncbi:TolB family protein [Streptomyces longwoodensis]|uniref:TolB family protein n=1 Tax=Streptomyces longwoodensis TaxID=68231 RepID=UPI0034103F37